MGSLAFLPQITQFYVNGLLFVDLFTTTPRARGGRSGQQVPELLLILTGILRGSSSRMLLRREWRGVRGMSGASFHYGLMSDFMEGNIIAEAFRVLSGLLIAVAWYVICLPVYVFRKKR